MPSVPVKGFDALTEQQKLDFEYYLFHLEWQTKMATSLEEAECLFFGDCWIAPEQTEES